MELLKSFDFGCLIENDKNKLVSLCRNEKINSLIIVIVEKNNAILRFLKKDISKQYIEIFACNALFGKNGLGKEKEGDMKTPVGDYGIIHAFGIKKNPGTSLEYLQINENHFCCDENTEFYNKIIDVSEVKHQCSGEHMSNYIPQYNYGLVTDYNKECVYPKGSAIFIHCKGKKDYTAGCVAIEEEYMLRLLKEIDINTRVCIFQSSN